MESPDFIKNLMPKIVPQTKVAFIGYALVVLSYIVIMIMSKNYGILNWIILALLIVTLIFGSYVINCTVVGQCNILAWVIGIYVLLMGVFWIVGVMVGRNSISKSGRNSSFSPMKPMQPAMQTIKPLQTMKAMKPVKVKATKRRTRKN